MLRGKTKFVLIPIIGIVIMVFLLSVSYSPSPSSNTDGIQVGECVEHRANPEIYGVVLRTSKNTVSVRIVDAQTQRFWRYAEIRRKPCPTTRGN